MATNTRPSLTTDLAQRYDASDDSAAPKNVAGFTSNIIQGSVSSVATKTSIYAPSAAQLVPYTSADVAAL